MLIDGPQLDSRVWKGRGHLAQERAQVLLELRLGLRVSLRMTRPRCQPAGAEPSQKAPAQLTADLTSQTLAEPGGHTTSAPAVTLRMGASQRCSQLRQAGGRQVWPPGTQRVAPVAHAVWAVSVVPSGDVADPMRRIARHGGHGACHHAAGQQPEEVPKTAQWLRSTGSSAPR
jgi:hypothetical protein